MSPPPRPFHPRRSLVVFTVLLVLTLWMFMRDRPGPPHPVLHGATMGTTYTVKLAHSRLGVRALKQTREEITALLVEINLAMSTYMPESEISEFNTRTSTEPFAVSPPFREVAQIAAMLNERSTGAFDPTLGPLIDLWGFGSGTASTGPPTADVIEAAMAVSGYRHFHLLDDGRVRKDLPGLQLNFSAVAKGYAVDRLADVLRNRGATNLFVEVGGEVYAEGVNDQDIPWRIGIEVPDPALLPGQELQQIVHLSGTGVATSGDYRNFRLDAGGKVLSHIIDPRTGRPVGHRLASVTVIAPTCALADGLATAAFVMGPEEGLAWMEAFPDAEALFITRDPDGGWVESMTTGLNRYLSPAVP